MNNLTITQIQEKMETGSLTSVELCRESLRKIEMWNASGPELRAVIEVCEKTLEIAAELDAERRKTGPRSLLHGIPVAVKDNIETTDGMQTTAGSLALNGYRAQKDAYIVKQLRKAGAIIIAKTNLSEWANFRSTKSSSGWSSRGGQCRNPYDITRSPCGSSSGSAVAVAAGIVPVAIGTETDGSIICPSSINSLVGIKPTMGRVSRSGIIPIAAAQDTAGPMATCVEDAAIVLEVLSGYDENDTVTKRYADYSRNESGNEILAAGLGKASLKDVRIGILDNLGRFDPRVDEVFDQHIAAMRQAGAVVVEECSFPNVGKNGDAELTVLLYEFKAGLNEFLKVRSGALGDCPRSLEELIAYNEKFADTIMPHFDQELFKQAQEKGSLTDKEYLDALETCKRAADIEGLGFLFREKNVDVLAAPSNGPAWKIDHVNGDRYTGGNSSPAAVSGYPSITLPAGYISGLPIGTTLIGQPFSEKRLIEIAYALEQAYPVRKVPKGFRD